MRFGALVLPARVGEEYFFQQRYAAAVLAFNGIQGFLETFGNFTEVKVIIDTKINNGAVTAGRFA